MNWHQIERQWQNVSRQIMLTWGKFSDDDLVYIGGNRDRFADLYKRHYGGSDAWAISRVDEFARCLPATTLSETPAQINGR